MIDFWLAAGLLLLIALSFLLILFTLGATATQNRNQQKTQGNQ